MSIWISGRTAEAMRDSVFKFALGASEALPTETVYSLGVDAIYAKVFAHLSEVKFRSNDKLLMVNVAHLKYSERRIS